MGIQPTHVFSGIHNFPGKVVQVSLSSVKAGILSLHFAQHQSYSYLQGWHLTGGDRVVLFSVAIENFRGNSLRVTVNGEGRVQQTPWKEFTHIFMLIFYAVLDGSISKAREVSTQM